MVRRKSCSKVILIFFVLSLFLPLFFNSDVAAGTKQNIYDYADLLADEEGPKRPSIFMKNVL